MPSSVPPKKKRKLPYEALYVDALPKGLRYSKSLMHKDQVASVTVVPSPSDFVITTSIDVLLSSGRRPRLALSSQRSTEHIAEEFRARVLV